MLFVCLARRSTTTCLLIIIPSRPPQAPLSYIKLHFPMAQEFWINLYGVDLALAVQLTTIKYEYAPSGPWPRHGGISTPLLLPVRKPLELFMNPTTADSDGPVPFVCGAIYLSHQEATKKKRTLRNYCVCARAAEATSDFSRCSLRLISSSSLPSSCPLDLQPRNTLRR